MYQQRTDSVIDTKLIDFQLSLTNDLKRNKRKFYEFEKVGAYT